MNREDLKNYKYNQMWIEDQIEYIEIQRERVNKLNNIMIGITKRKYKKTR